MDEPRVESALVVVRWTQFWDMHSGGRTKVVIDDVEYNQIVPDEVGWSSRWMGD